MNAALAPLGYAAVRAPKAPDWRGREAKVAATLRELELHRIQYGCWTNMIEGWVNADLADPRGHVRGQDRAYFMRLDLAGPQPFPDGWFECAYAEDFLEHLTQEQALVFLAETLRVLAPGGVLRLSFPGLEGVLARHFKGRAGHAGARTGADEAFTAWEHRHFFSRPELEAAAKALGWSHVRFVARNQSVVPDLQNRETRAGQDDLNTYAELVK